jgi:flagellar hook-associated protein 2
MATASGISTPGIGSGLDVNSIVSQLMTLERRPLAVLDRKEQDYRTKLTAFGSLKSTLAALQTAAQALNTPEKFPSFKSTVSDDKVLTASAGTAAAAGSYSLEVLSLAKAQQLTRGGFASADAVVGAGTLRIEVGGYDAGTFAADPGKTAKDIVIDPGANTLAAVRNAINAAGAGVSATIVNGTNGSQLFLTATDTGTSSAVRITVADADGNNTDAAGLSQLAYDPTTAGGNISNLTQVAAPANANLKVNGVDVSSASNKVSGAIDALTLSLLKTNAGAPVQVDIAKDTVAMKSKIEAFVKSYNDAHQAIKDLTAFDPATRRAAALNGETAARAAQSQLRATLGAPIAGAVGDVSRLSDIGLTFQLDGKLAINDSKLEAALNDPGKNVTALFVNAGGVEGYAAKVDTIVKNMLGTDGSIANRTDAINESIRDLGTRRDALTTRMDQTETRLRRQFVALDAAIARMQSTSSYLQQQLAGLTAQQKR